MPNLSRRDFLKFTTQGLLAASSLLGLGGLFRFLSYRTEPARVVEFDLGLAVNYPPGSRTLLSDIPAVLLHTESGFSALSLVCTHLGCTVKQTAQGFSCPCHGSHFMQDGSVSQGPAQDHLAALRIERTGDGHLILYRV